MSGKLGKMTNVPQTVSVHRVPPPTSTGLLDIVANSGTIPFYVAQATADVWLGVTAAFSFYIVAADTAHTRVLDYLAGVHVDSTFVLENSRLILWESPLAGYGYEIRPGEVLAFYYPDGVPGDLMAAAVYAT